MNKKAVIYVLLCCLIVNLFAWRIRFFIDFFNLAIDLSLISLILRMTFVGVYISSIFHMYYIKQNNHIDLMTPLVYSHNFDVEKYGSSYSTFMFNCSLTLFLPIILLLGVFQYTGIDARLDLLFFIISMFIFLKIDYENSRTLSKLT